MGPFQILAVLLATSSPNSGSTDTTVHTVFEVCMSPGCIADGAKETLQKLQALAPPGVTVQPGGCVSLCGNGPIVISPEEKTVIKHRRVSGKKVLDLLLKISDEEPSYEPPPESLLEGYDLVLEANEAFAKKDYTTAVTLYETALEKSFRPAMEFQAIRDKLKIRHNDKKQPSSTAKTTITPITTTSTTRVPTALQWLVDARRNEAAAKLELGDTDGALFAAQASCNISRNTCPESFEVLAEVYRTKGDAADELEALKNMMNLTRHQNDKDVPFAVRSKRRELKFRLEKLEREAAATN